MKFALALFLVPFLFLWAHAADPTLAGFPQPPDATLVAQWLQIKTGNPRVTVEPSPKANMASKIVWDATYHFDNKSPLFIHISLFRPGKINTKSMEDIANHPELNYQKLTEPNGDVIYHFLGSRGGPDGTMYCTTLIRHQKDWDMMVILGTGAGVDAKQLPIDISQAGIPFIRQLGTALGK